VSKTNYVLFSANKTVQNTSEILKLGNEVIEEREWVKFLGIYIDKTLQWSQHLKICKAKLAASIYMINSMKNILGTEHLLTLYYALVHSYLNYGIILWGNANKGLLNPLIKYQKRAIRIIDGASYNAPTDSIYQRYNIMTVNEMYEAQLSSFMFDFTQGNLPSPLQEIFTTNHNMHQYNTRQRNDPHTRARRYAFTSRSLIHNGPKLWQNLPIDLKQKHTSKAFKRNFKKYIINKKMGGQ